MRYALIDPEGVTQNIILIGENSDYPLEPGWTLGDPDEHPLPSPPEPVPESVSPRQIKLALLGAGLLDEVEAFAAQADRATQISWEYATAFLRDDALLNAMAAAFGVSGDQLDQLFRTAAAL
jgi:hypothetical protein